ncbi:MAG: putative acetamidase/formamidase [Chloroflexi bacterium]|nr:putative acetamidase/formamidase [Chloroflexota bacterium]
MSIHHLQHEALHRAWNRDLPPVLTVDPGDTVVFSTIDAADGKIPAPTWAAAPPNSSAWGVHPLEVESGHPICGPVAIRGAEPGDTLVVEVLEIVPNSWGWTAIGDHGVLGTEFAERALVYWDLRSGEVAVPWAPEGEPVMAARVPMLPFCGVMGVAPAEPGEQSTIPPRTVGGNMDVRFLTTGSTLLLPVAVEQALFSVGDVHAAQGDGEVSGTGIECHATVTLRFDLRRGRKLAQPEFYTPRRIIEGPCYGTAGVSPDLMEATRQAVWQMIAYLTAEHGFRATDAYILCSAAVDLTVSEVVDGPNWIVSALLPLRVLST